jgi:hypothetical protein
MRSPKRLPKREPLSQGVAAILRAVWAKARGASGAAVSGSEPRLYVVSHFVPGETPTLITVPTCQRKENPQGQTAHQWQFVANFSEGAGGEHLTTRRPRTTPCAPDQQRQKLEGPSDGWPRRARLRQLVTTPGGDPAKPPDPGDPSRVELEEPQGGDRGARSPAAIGLHSATIHSANR